jgi:hypothetical protein
VKLHPLQTSRSGCNRRTQQSLNPSPQPTTLQSLHPQHAKFTIQFTQRPHSLQSLLNVNCSGLSQYATQARHCSDGDLPFTSSLFSPDLLPFFLLPFVPLPFFPSAPFSIRPSSPPFHVAHTAGRNQSPGTSLRRTGTAAQPPQLWPSCPSSSEIDGQLPRTPLHEPAPVHEIPRTDPLARDREIVTAKAAKGAATGSSVSGTGMCPDFCHRNPKHPWKHPLPNRSSARETPRAISSWRRRRREISSKISRGTADSLSRGTGTGLQGSAEPVTYGCAVSMSRCPLCGLIPKGG